MGSDTRCNCSTCSVVRLLPCFRASDAVFAALRVSMAALVFKPSPMRNSRQSLLPSCIVSAAGAGCLASLEVGKTATLASALFFASVSFFVDATACLVWTAGGTLSLAFNCRALAHFRPAGCGTGDPDCLGFCSGCSGGATACFCVAFLLLLHLLLR